MLDDLVACWNTPRAPAHTNRDRTSARKTKERDKKTENIYLREKRDRERVGDW